MAAPDVPPKPPEPIEIPRVSPPSPGCLTRFLCTLESSIPRPYLPFSFFHPRISKFQLLRNSRWNCLCGNEFEAHGFGSFLQRLELSDLELLFIGFEPMADIGFPVFDKTINDPG